MLEPSRKIAIEATPEGESLVAAAESAVVCCVPLASPVITGEEAAATAQLFRALGDPHRVRIVNLLARQGPMTGEELIEPLRLSQGTVSHHLKKLTEAGLLDRRPQGRLAYYALNADALRKLAAVADLRGICC
jgi:ArsR family transcriptional regulator